MTGMSMKAAACLGVAAALGPGSGAGPAPAAPPPAARAETWWYQPGRPHRLEMSGGQFRMDGKRIVFVCGEMHPLRIPRAYWRDRIRRAKAMGLNAVSVYVFWSAHERVKGRFDFTGDRDIAAFVRLCGEEGLYVFLRPGPYVCAEWDFGGYPWWILQERGLNIRSRDPAFLALMRRYIAEIGRQFAPLQITRGGPVFMLQVENEYGSYGSDKAYLAAIRDMYRQAGFDILLNTCDGGGQMPKGCVEGCLPTINGALGDDIFRFIDRCHPGGPYFVSEFYPAWFDVWGRGHSRRDARDAAAKLDWMLARGVSVSIYMFHGGTNFAFTNGANQQSDDQPYAPQPTSYDYDAPLGESGNITEKYRMFRDAIAKYLPAGVALPDIPPDNPVAVVPRFETTASAALTDLAGRGGPFAARAVTSRAPLTMEALGQDYGYVLYRAAVPAGFRGRLKVDAVRDYVVVMINGRVAGTLDRRLNQAELPVRIPPGGTLDLLVENVGRLNYGRLIFDNHKGITRAVLLDGKPLEGWTQIPLPLHRDNVSALPFGAPMRGAPAFHRATFRLDTPGDVFLDLGAWGKGAVWVNGRSVGKFWRIGPQQTLYVPGPWLRAGENEVIVFEILDQGNRALAGREKAVLDETRPDAAATVRPGKDPVLEAGDLAWQGDLAARGATPQEIRFKPVTARHVCLEFGPSREGEPFVCVSEIEFLDADGRPIPRAAYSVWWADSEERGEEASCAAENTFDGNPKTYWHTAWKDPPAPPPHRLVMDLGTMGAVGGFRLTGRDQPQGYPKEVKLYARPQFFL